MCLFLFVKMNQVWRALRFLLMINELYVTKIICSKIGIVVVASVILVMIYHHNEQLY